MPATAKVVPNIFVQSACLGNAWAAQAAWVKRMPELNGFSPFEVWDHPELLLSEADRETNPSIGPLTMAAIRSRIIHTVKPSAHAGATLTPADVHVIGNLPFASVTGEVTHPSSYEGVPTISIPALHKLTAVREEDPASINDIGRTASVGGNNGHKPAATFRHANRRARRGGRAFRSR